MALEPVQYLGVYGFLNIIDLLGNSKVCFSFLHIFYNISGVLSIFQLNYL